MLICRALPYPFQLSPSISKKTLFSALDLFVGASLCCIISKKTLLSVLDLLVGASLCYSISKKTLLSVLDLLDGSSLCCSCRYVKEHYDLRCYSASYSSSQSHQPREIKFKKGKNNGGSSSSKSWSFNDLELQRKKRVASYKVYTMEGKVKGSFKKSFRWLKDRYTQIVYGWW